MEKKLLDEFQEGDPISVALRGGAGWLHGKLVWRREGIILLEVDSKALRAETPWVVVVLAEVSAVAVPRKVDPPTAEGRSPGFLK